MSREAPPCPDPRPDPGQTALVFAAQDGFICHGVNQGDGLDRPDQVGLEDIHHLDAKARPFRLVLRAPAGGVQEVAEASLIGRAGARVALRAIR